MKQDISLYRWLSAGVSPSSLMGHASGLLSIPEALAQAQEAD